MAETPHLIKLLQAQMGRVVPRGRQAGGLGEAVGKICPRPWRPALQQRK